MNQAKQTYASVLELTASSSTIEQVSAFYDSATESKFAAMHLDALSAIREKHGRNSEEYAATAVDIRSFLEAALEQSETLQIAILTYSLSSRFSHSKRQSNPLQSQAPLPSNRPTPQEPIGSISTCFSTLDACTNRTSTCSGRGQCMEASKGGRTCFVCACGVTTTGEGNKRKTQTWVGESCERKDISGSVTYALAIELLLTLYITVPSPFWQGHPCF